MQVPALQEGDFVLPESCAILRYLCNSRRQVPDHWHAPLCSPFTALPRRCVARLMRVFMRMSLCALTPFPPTRRYPVRPRERARVDAALDWHHATLRRGAAALVFARVFAGNNADVADDPVRPSHDTSMNAKL